MRFLLPFAEKDGGFTLVSARSKPQALHPVCKRVKISDEKDTDRFRTIIQGEVSA